MTADAAATVDKDRTRGEQLALSAWCVVAAFGAYFCMYAFRRPYTAAEFTDYTLWGVGYKTVLVSSQVIGYTISKFVGIKIVSEMAASRRAGSILVLIAIAQVSLLLFGLVPPPYNFVCLFLNGLPLGMVFGLVLCFLEGRRVTEALNAGLCASFILADGVTKSVGAYLLQAGVSQFWMPFAAGLFFIPALLLFVWMLAQIPPPGPSDVALRSLRTPMNRGERRGFFRRYSLGIVLIVLVYLLVTVMRSIRADFAPEIWSGLGYTGQPSVFARSELLVVLAVMAVCGLGFLIVDNQRAFFFALSVALGGMGVLVVALLGLSGGWLGGFPFMVLLGLGLYLPYLVVHTTIFERLIAMSRERANIGYLMYLADAFGYLGYVVVMFGKGLFAVQESFLSFFITVSWVIAVAATVLLVRCWWYFSSSCRSAGAIPATQDALLT